MGTTCFTSSSSSSFVNKITTKTRTVRTRFLEPSSSSSSLSSKIHFRYSKLSTFLSLSVSLSQSLSPPPESFASPLWPTNPKKSRLSSSSSVSALVDEEPLTATTGDTNGEEENNVGDGSVSDNLLRHCELYVCNLPRSFGISELLDTFKPYGTIQSVEVSRNAETGISKGCGYVTISSMDEAKAAIAALDGSDVGGREMRVTFSADMNTHRSYLESLNSLSKKNLIFETPYKIYVGNLAWSVKPEDLKKLFTQVGTVNSSRVLHDRKSGKNRVYGFLSFSSPAESEAALSLNGTEFFGRTLVVREVAKTTEP